MNRIEAQQRLRTLASPAIETRDAAALLQVSTSNPTTILRRLAAEGMVDQIPPILYAVTPARPRRLRTPLGAISFHRMPPELFKGFELSTVSDAKIATPEKALFDLVYLAPGRSRLFSRLPELAIPRRFQWRRVKEYTELVNSPGRRAFIAERVKAIRSDASGS